VAAANLFSPYYELQTMYYFFFLACLFHFRIIHSDQDELRRRYRRFIFKVSPFCPASLRRLGIVYVMYHLEKSLGSQTFYLCFVMLLSVLNNVECPQIFAQKAINNTQMLKTVPDKSP
jgi:hypothetical protein